MKQRHFLNALGNVDESYIEEAAATIGSKSSGARIHRRIPAALIAAILAMLLMGWALFWRDDWPGDDRGAGSGIGSFEPGNWSKQNNR